MAIICSGKCPIKYTQADFPKNSIIICITSILDILITDGRGGKWKILIYDREIPLIYAIMSKIYVCFTKVKNVEYLEGYSHFSPVKVA